MEPSFSKTSSLSPSDRPSFTMISLCFILSGNLPDMPFPYTGEKPRIVPDSILIPRYFQNLAEIPGTGFLLNTQSYGRLHCLRTLSRIRGKNSYDKRKLLCNRITLLHSSYSFSVYLAFVTNFAIFGITFCVCLSCQIESIYEKPKNSG